MPNEADGQQATTEIPDFDFDTWLGEQPEHVRKGYEGKTQGLHSALEKERGERQGLAKEIKRLSGLAEKGSELEKTLAEMTTRNEQAEQRAAFYEDAIKPEIGCTNVRMAFLVATADNLFKRSGEPDWMAIKAAAPELFASRKAPPGNAGSGNGSPPAQGKSMNDFIRAASGRG